MDNRIASVLSFSHKSVEYFTPPGLIEAARMVMDGIDLDPASCAKANEVVRAKEFYTAEDDGLSREWHGRVWLNPPYSMRDGRSNQELWAAHLINEYTSGRVTQALLLTRAALGYNWFECLVDHWPVCLMRYRPSFTYPNGTSPGQAKQAHAIFYFGQNLEQFTKVFGLLIRGRIIVPSL